MLPRALALARVARVASRMCIQLFFIHNIQENFLNFAQTIPEILTLVVGMSSGWGNGK